MLASVLITSLSLSAGLLAAAVSDRDAPELLKRFEFAETHMGSTFKIVLYSTDEDAARSASRAAFARIAALDAALSDYDPESELSRLCRQAGGPAVPASQDLFEVLDLAKQFHERTGGVFDVTIAPVGRLWRRARRDRRPPDPEKLQSALSLVGASHLLLDRQAQTVRLEKPGMRLDLGGIAKGYAAQAAADVLRSHGISRHLVGGAGDLVVGDPPPEAKGWTIGVAGLEPSETPPEIYLLLANAAISTAGDAERYVIINGRRYSHIINPVTGIAVEDRASVTVVAADGATADALETAVYLLGPEKGLELVERTPGAAALYVRATPEGIKTFESSRFRLLPRTGPKPNPVN